MSREMCLLYVEKIHFYDDDCDGKWKEIPPNTIRVFFICTLYVGKEFCIHKRHLCTFRNVFLELVAINKSFHARRDTSPCYECILKNVFWKSVQILFLILIPSEWCTTAVSIHPPCVKCYIYLCSCNKNLL